MRYRAFRTGFESKVAENRGMEKRVIESGLLQ